MEREGFIKNCGLACLGGSLLAVFLEELPAAANRSEGTIENADLIVPVSSFRTRKII